MKKIRLYELMTDNYMHNQYMYGAYKHYENYEREFFALNGVMLKEYAGTIVGDENEIKIRFFKSQFFLMAMLFFDIFRNKYKVVITGSRTHWILLLSIISWKNSLDIHLHGQFYGSFESKYKKWLWNFIGNRVSLKLACPYYRSDVNLEILEGIHLLPDTARRKVTDYNRKNKKVIGILSGIGRAKWKGFERLTDLENLGYQIRYYEPAIESVNEWNNYLEFMREIDYLYLNPVNDYFLFSPSGVITDSKNYKKPMIAFESNKFIDNLIKRGCTGFKLISSKS